MDDPQVKLAKAWRLVQEGRGILAMPLLRELQSESPKDARPWVILGSILLERGRTEEAAPMALQALERDPGNADAWNLLGLVRRHSGDGEGAWEAFQEAHRLAPEHAWVALNLADQCLRRRDPVQALLLLETALAGLPELEEVHLDRAVALVELNRRGEAEAILRRLLERNPESVRIRLNLANTLLAMGRMTPEAWRLRECRWEAMGAARRDMPMPAWDGAAFPGKTLLLHGRQEGLGDAVMFVRYASAVKALGGRVILECPPSLARLFRSCPGIDEALAQGDAVPDADLHAVLTSLPALLGEGLVEPFGRVPYLQPPDPAEVPNRAALEARLAGIQGRRALGLVWAGNRGHLDDEQRSLPLDACACLAQSPGVLFVGLQKREPGEPAPLVPAGLPFLDLGDLLSDFSDTAHALTRLEGLLSVDTSVAHLAGALGLPVMLLLAHRAEWRWMADREDSPWYPTFRLYRQSSPGDWASVLARVVQELQRGRGTC